MKTKCEYSGTLFIISRKYFSVFRGPHLPLDTPFWTRCFPLVMQSRKAGFPFAARARKREPCLQRYVSRMTRTENFLSQFFSNIFWKPLLSTFYGTLFIISRKYFFEVRTPHLPIDTPFWTRGFSLVIFGPSHSRYVPLKAGLPLPSSCCKGEACLPRSLQLDFFY